MAKDLKVHIRWMIQRDMAEVLDIEKLSYEYPWSEEDFIHCLRQRNVIGMVAELGCTGQLKGNVYAPIAAFFMYELHATRLHLLSLAVHPDYRYRSVGRQCLDKLLGKLSSQRRVRITLECRETNLAAQLFFHSHGFKAVTVLHNCYDDSEEDSYLFQYSYADAEAATEAAR